MPALRPKGMAYDVATNTTYVVANHGKDRYLLELSDAMTLKVVRKLPATNSDIFWIATGHNCAVFWKGESTVVVPLTDDPKAGKTKSLKGKLLWRAQFATATPGLYGVTEDHRVCRF